MLITKALDKKIYFHLCSEDKQKSYGFETMSENDYRMFTL